jgi:hypothetical protein
MPVTACDLLYDRVLPFYEALGVPIGAILSDNGREFCGKPESHPFKLLLSLEAIEHRTDLPAFLVPVEPRKWRCLNRLGSSDQNEG